MKSIYYRINSWQKSAYYANSIEVNAIHVQVQSKAKKESAA